MTTAPELRVAIPDDLPIAAHADDLVAALVAEAEAHITEHVEEGSLTEEEAAAKLADIADRVSERVNSVAPAGGEGHGPGHRGGDRGGHRGGH